jgi:Pregnancy-associated plasma protein-A/Secretion system C-terminal sorting domain
MKYFLPLPVLLLIHLASIAQLNCRSTEYRQDLISRNPGIAANIQEIEAFTRHQLQAPRVAVTGADPSTSTSTNTGTTATDVITIPVVVHIIYNSAGQNISDAQVQSQIEVLNRDYRKMNADTAGIPGYFSPLAADCGFQFVLANADTNGYASTGIVRKHTNVQAFSINDDIKYTAKGGDDAWDRDRYLNIWVGNLTGGILGYSSVVGGPKQTDGVTVLYTAFGTMGTATAPFNLGKTTTHEIGHWLNMIHVWGDAFCGDDDVADTPPQQQATYGNPSGIIISCGNAPTGNMYMNYMDFTDDIGMHMFTYGQRDRMRTLFDAGGFRYPILSSNAITGTPIPSYGSADPDSSGIGGAVFSVYPNPVVSMATVTMTDASLIGSLLEVYNQVGQMLMATRISALTFQFNVSSMPKGIYFIRVSDGKHVNAFKMVKI